MRRIALYVLYFLSGGSALIYELIWQRQLNLVFGVSTLSVSTVMAAYMGGLALGGLLFGRFADRARHPLRWYALLEAGIGIIALLLPLAFAVLVSAYTFAYAFLQPGQWGGVCLRFGIAFPMLVGLATLIGGTLPFMGRLALGRHAALPTTFSLIYAINTLGAVAGVALTGFVLLRLLGMQQTLWIAAGLNFVVAAAALAGSFLWQPEKSPTPAPEAAQGPLRSASWVARTMYELHRKALQKRAYRYRQRAPAADQPLQIDSTASRSAGIASSWNLRSAATKASTSVGRLQQWRSPRRTSRGYF